MNTTGLPWSESDVCIQASCMPLHSLAAEVYRRVCRTDFSAPGFCVVSVAGDSTSKGFRQLMVDIKTAMSAVHQSVASKTLVYQSAARFDQQETTRPHLDGGPKENFLMLGYEPTAVESLIEISDYTRCAIDLGLSPLEFMQQHNPMFASNQDLLLPYTTALSCFRSQEYQIVCINNSTASPNEISPAWLGTLHTARILSPDESKRRVINSTMIASAPLGTDEPVSEQQLQQFVTTTSLRRRGYDKPHLADDL